MSLDYLTALIAAVLFAAAPLILAALGETISERAGVINLSLDGTVLFAAMVAFAAARATGATNNDPIVTPPESNHAGGILGGIANGQPIVARVAVKPIPSIAVPQRTTDIHGNPAQIVVGGRHDRSAIPRVVPVVRAMVLLVLADLWLAQRLLTA